ncbi:MAG: insulinase family protein [Archangium sp.]|nr:insulinase family protein [Archangium sp.]
MFRLLITTPVLVLLGCQVHHAPLPEKMGAAPSTTLQYPSGLRVVFEQHPGSQRLAMALLVGAGASNDPPGRAGLAHLLEHVAYRSRPSHRLTAAEELEFAGVSSAGMEESVSTLNDTVYSGITSGDRAGPALSLLASLVVNPLMDVDDAALELERSIVRSERLLRDPHGGGDLAAAVRQATLGGRQESSIGTETSLSSITRADLEAFIAARYRPRALTVMLVGDLEPASIDALVRAAFPPAWLAAGAGGIQQPLQLVVEDPGVGITRGGLSVPPPPPQGEFPPVVEGPVLQRQVMFAWAVPGTTQPGGMAVPRLAGVLAWRFRDVGKDLGVTRIAADYLLGVRTSVVVVFAEVDSTANLAAVRKAFRETGLGHFWRVNLRSLTMERLREEQHLLTHAQNRARLIFATGSTRAEQYWGSQANFAALEELDERVLTWERAREIDVVPMLETNTSPPLPPAQTSKPRQLVVTRQMLESATLPLSLPAARHFTLPNGLQVVLSRRGPVPVAVVKLALPAGARSTSRAVSALAGSVIQWWPRRRPPPARFGRPRVSVNADETVIELSSASWELPVMLDVIGHNTTPRVIWGGARVLEQWADEFIDEAAQAEWEGHWNQVLPTSELKRTVLPEGSALLPVKVAEVKELPESDFLDFFELAFRPNGAVLTVDGDLDLDATEAIVRELFTDWQPRKARARARALRDLGAPPVRAAAPIVLEGKSSTLTRVRFVCRLPPAPTVESRGAHRLLGAALEQTFEHELRDTLGLASGVWVDVSDLRTEDNLLAFNTRLDPRGGQQALAQFLERLDALDGAVWDEQQVDLARWRVARDSISSGGTSEAVTTRLAVELVHGAPYERAVVMSRLLATVPLKWVDEAWAACTDTLVLELEGDRRSIERVLQARKK